MTGDFLGALSTRQFARHFALSSGQKIETVQPPQGQASKVHVLEAGCRLDRYDQIVVGQDMGAGPADQACQLFGQVVTRPARPDIAELLAQSVQTEKAYAILRGEDGYRTWHNGAAGF